MSRKWYSEEDHFSLASVECTSNLMDFQGTPKSPILYICPASPSCGVVAAAGKESSRKASAWLLLSGDPKPEILCRSAPPGYRPRPERLEELKKCYAEQSTRRAAAGSESNTSERAR
jgi:hypothetical protein